MISYVVDSNIISAASQDISPTVPHDNLEELLGHKPLVLALGELLLDKDPP